MTAFLYIGAVVLLMLAAGEGIPVYLTVMGLFQGQAETDSAYFIGKLLGHLFILVLLLVLSAKLFKRAKGRDSDRVESV